MTTAFLLCEAVFGGLSLNLLLQFALGAGAVSTTTASRWTLPFLQLLILTTVTLGLWGLYRAAAPLLAPGLLEYFLAFPLCALGCFALETTLDRILPGTPGQKTFRALTAYDGLALAAFLLTSYLAVTVVDAIVLTLGFALGCLVALIILGEIRRRARLERVPHNLRGSPLMLIALGLLAMVFAACAWLFFALIETLA